MEFIGRCIGELADLDVQMAGEDFLLTWDKSDAEIRATALVADALKALHRRGVSLKVFETGVAVSIFRDKSTRTRFSFASAANALGLALADLDEEKSQISHGETVRETANMIAFLSEVIGIRDDMYLGEGNRYMREVAAAVDEGFRAGVLHQRPAVVNLQCDIDHPTQTMADLLWLKEHFGSFEALRGKRIAMTWAYSPSYGKPLSVPQGIIGLMTRFGMDVVLAHPDGYNLIPEVEQVAATHATRSGGRYTRVASMAEAFRDADVVYPKSWAPYPVMQRRTELLKNRDKQGLADLERECLAQNAKHQDWECTDEMMRLTRGGAALYMHCLPADISGVSCERGEVAAPVFDRYRLQTYREAGYKPFVIAAMILLARFAEPAGVLDAIARRATRRLL
ncbi:MAG TPA: knotted carbamoyltransferase YgeW [Acidobacteriota bacterium]|nr:knotted carbamoyltransferase YgeW [Acidobacteriota bacterium]HNR40201.1 knotted carbamoyltransferase YgeW [Acidobacteriota bacterium]HNU02225.1 knotted carbamoyltransferase YgeW [Acidobacteriota bacterium]